MKIDEVAELSGVSITTVSRVINNQKVNEETKLRVLAVIRKHNYKPNPHARNLARKRNGEEQIF
ncbi:MAG: LacI family DNA-binding transcriptional regulator [Candidatus Omnitrophica bacterium]|nr:LacI family DNA-binding transcriptional regulator [Candidatus Omnitrophota bacterium]